MTKGKMQIETEWKGSEWDKGESVTAETSLRSNWGIEILRWYFQSVSSI